MARESRIRSLLALGDIAAADREIAAGAELAEELRLPIYRHSIRRFQLARALGSGQLDEAERLNRDVLELSEAANDADGRLGFEIFQWWIGFQRGDVEPAARRAEALAERMAFLGALPGAVVAMLLVELGDHEGARRHYEPIAAAGFSEIPRDEAWLLTLAALAETCARLGDAERAPLLYEMLRPYADLLVAHQHMRVYMGSVEYPLARLSQVAGELDRARAHFEAGLAAGERIGAVPFTIRCALAYAELLVGGEAPASADRARAREVLARAESLAEAMGATGLLEQTCALTDRTTL